MYRYLQLRYPSCQFLSPHLGSRSCSKEPTAADSMMNELDRASYCDALSGTTVNLMQV